MVMGNIFLNEWNEAAQSLWALGQSAFTNCKVQISACFILLIKSLYENILFKGYIVLHPAATTTYTKHLSNTFVTVFLIG